MGREMGMGMVMVMRMRIGGRRGFLIEFLEV